MPTRTRAQVDLLLQRLDEHFLTQTGAYIIRYGFDDGALLTFVTLARNLGWHVEQTEDCVTITYPAEKP